MYHQDDKNISSKLLVYRRIKFSTKNKWSQRKYSACGNQLKDYTPSFLANKGIPLIPLIVL